MIEHFTLIFFSFTVLLVTHIICLLIGWNLGIKGDPNILLSRPDKSKPDSYKAVDPFAEEMLDYE